MTTSQVFCPKCGATTVQGQLVPMKNFVAGFLTALLTDDMAASVLVMQNGKLTVQDFCLSCGFVWLPFNEFMARLLRGEQGEAVRLRTEHELNELVQKGTGFKLVSNEAKDMATWAQSMLSAAKNQGL